MLNSDGNPEESEGESYLQLHNNWPGTLWIQTSYNTQAGKHYDPITQEEDDGVALRKNFAGIGYTYDKSRDAFIPPQPYPSWPLDEEMCVWVCPVPHPNENATDENPGDGKDYEWDEATTNWKEIPE